MPSVMLSHTTISRLIPHHGAMCLLDGVQRWDADQIVCTATGHREPAHPLRDGAVLPAWCGIEYAAQAIAVHRGLLAGEAGGRRIGVIGALRNVIMSVDRLDDIAEDLAITGSKVFERGDSVMYDFVVAAGERALLTGRISVMITSGLHRGDRAE